MRGFMGEDARRLRYWSAGLSVLAGKVHGLVMFEHFNEWWAYGLFFLIAASCQVLYGILLVLRPWKRQAKADVYDRLAYVLGIAGNAAIVVFYLITRTLGVPVFGPEAGEVESITPISLASKAIELALIACLLALLHRTADSSTRARLNTSPG